MVSPVHVSASGVITWARESGPGSVHVRAEGLRVELASGATAEREAWEMGSVRRDGYTITVEFGPDEEVALEQFARRTDELETALWRCRCDAIAELMAPAGERPLEVIEASSESHGWLYRYQDGLRWVPCAGPCFVRLYGELEGARFDQSLYTVTLHGLFGENVLSGLARRTTELVHEVAQRVVEARGAFAASLAQAELAWADEARAGAIRQHVPFEANQEQLEAAEGGAARRRPGRAAAGERRRRGRRAASRAMSRGRRRAL